MARLDENFICGKCSRTLIPTGEKEDGLIVYQCCIYKVGRQLECPICHCPRTLWAEYRKICSFCSGSFYLNLGTAIKSAVG